MAQYWVKSCPPCALSPTPITVGASWAMMASFCLISSALSDGGEEDVDWAKAVRAPIANSKSIVKKIFMPWIRHRDNSVKMGGGNLKGNFNHRWAQIKHRFFTAKETEEGNTRKTAYCSRRA